VPLLHLPLRLLTHAGHKELRHSLANHASTLWSLDILELSCFRTMMGVHSVPGRLFVCHDFVVLRPAVKPLHPAPIAPTCCRTRVVVMWYYAIKGACAPVRLGFRELRHYLIGSPFGPQWYVSAHQDVWLCMEQILFYWTRAVGVLLVSCQRYRILSLSIPSIPSRMTTARA
jgi:hypothetical protein